MDTWPTPPEREPSGALGAPPEIKGPPGRHTETLREVRAYCRRLEERAELKITQGETEMGKSKVDGDLLRADAAAGMGRTALAEKYQVALSTVGYHLNPPKREANGRVSSRDARGKFRSTAEGTNGEARPSGGNGLELAADEVRKLAALAEARWQSLPFSEKLQLLIAWGVG
jgi:hypothetical protein